eukprot:240368-Prymnesium_polylepis.1
MPPSSAVGWLSALRQGPTMKPAPALRASAYRCMTTGSVHPPSYSRLRRRKLGLTCPRAGTILPFRSRTSRIAITAEHAIDSHRSGSAAPPSCVSMTSTPMTGSEVLLAGAAQQACELSQASIRAEGGCGAAVWILSSRSAAHPVATGIAAELVQPRVAQSLHLARPYLGRPRHDEIESGKNSTEGITECC